jgi:hypothetical protein
MHLQMKPLVSKLGDHEINNRKRKKKKKLRYIHYEIEWVKSQDWKMCSVIEINTWRMIKQNIQLSMTVAAYKIVYKSVWYARDNYMLFIIYFEHMLTCNFEGKFFNFAARSATRFLKYSSMLIYRVQTPEMQK